MNVPELVLPCKIAQCNIQMYWPGMSCTNSDDVGKGKNTASDESTCSNFLCDQVDHWYEVVRRDATADELAKPAL